MRVHAEIPVVRIHDLRHTGASLLDSGGASLEMVGRLLGSPLRARVIAVGEMLKPRLSVVG